MCGQKNHFAKKSSEEHHAKWKAIWLAAESNMPARVRIQTEEYWERCPYKVSVGVLLKGLAEGKLEIENGRVFEKLEKKLRIRYGRRALMARLLGYYGTFRHGEKEGQRFPHNQRIYEAIGSGSKPRDPEKAKLLEALASKGGRSLAIQLMQQQGIRLHLYDLKGWDADVP